MAGSKYVPYPNVLFVMLTLFWSGSFLGIHYVVASLPPAFGAFCRVLSPSLQFPFSCSQGRHQERRLRSNCRRWEPAFLTWGFRGSSFYGEKFISPALASIQFHLHHIRDAICPLMLVHTHEQKERGRVLTGFIGILAVFGPHISADDVSQINAQLAIIGMAVCTGSASPGSKVQPRDTCDEEPLLPVHRRNDGAGGIQHIIRSLEDRSAAVPIRHGSASFTLRYAPPSWRGSCISA